MNVPCFISSFLFITNSINNYLRGDNIYSLLFFLLFITSLLHHYFCIIETNIIDKLSILGVVLYGGNLYYKKIIILQATTENVKLIYYVPLLCFWLTIILYLYGDITDQYCFNKNASVANSYHSLLHIISSIGHHAIIMI